MLRMNADMLMRKLKKMNPGQMVIRSLPLVACAGVLIGAGTYKLEHGSDHQASMETKKNASIGLRAASTKDIEGPSQEGPLPEAPVTANIIEADVAQDAAVTRAETYDYISESEHDDRVTTSFIVPESAFRPSARYLSKNDAPPITTGMIYTREEEQELESSLDEDNAEEELAEESPKTPTISPIAPSGGARNVILDLDYCSDIDDVVAIRIAAMMHREGRINLQGVMLCVTGDAPTRSAHAQLCYDGLPGIPIGSSAMEVHDGSPYWDRIIAADFDAGSYNCINSVELYKQIIRSNIASGQKCRVITTGFLTNLSALIDDPEGYELVKNGVDSFWITGGVWTAGGDNNFILGDTVATAAKHVIHDSPVPVVLSTNRSISNDIEVVMCGGTTLQKAQGTGDPVAIAFQAFGEVNNTDMTAGRFAWDPICTWAACLPAAETQMHVIPCRVGISDNGFNQFYPDATDYNCYVLMRDHENIGWYKNQLDTWCEKGIRETAPVIEEPVEVFDAGADDNG